MMVVCEVCSRSFKQITLTHLKSHSLTMADYRETYPDAVLISEEALAKVKAASQISNGVKKGIKRSAADMEAIRAGIAAAGPRTAHNKGQAMSEEQKKKLSDVAKVGFANGRKHGGNYERTPEIRAKISENLTGRKIGPEAALKSIQTKLDKGMDIAFFRGRKHTRESKASIAVNVSKRYREMRLTGRQYMADRINESQLLLLNSIDEDVFKLRCLTCSYEFQRNPSMFFDSKYHSMICDQCFPISPVSAAENEVADYVVAMGATVSRSDMELISPLEIDILDNTRKLGIEYCGIYWHSEKAGKSRWYHRKKLDLCREKGYRLITIFEDEWINKRPIVESMLSNILGKNTRKINARSCTVEVVDSKEGNIFVEENHIQGRGRANTYYVLRYNGEIVSLMSFSNNEVSRRSTGWDINRFCSLKGVSVRGAAGKLFKAFVNDHNPDSVVSYADLRWGTGRVYGEIGFSHAGDTVPNYWYFREGMLTRYHRYGFRKNAEDDQSLTEWENRQKQGMNRIWDCGHAKWVWEK